MLDFPNAPTANQVFTAPNGSTWVWDGAKWASTGAGTGFLPLTGGTLTGPLLQAADPVQPLGSATKQYVDAQNVRYRNRIINGDMSVDARNGGSIALPVGSVYAMDRWGWAGQGIGNGGQSALAPNLIAGFTYALYWQTTTAHTVVATDYSQFYQVIEGCNFNDANWGTANAQPVVLEFWASSSLTGIFAGSLKNYNGNRSYVFTYSLPNTSWTKIRINIPGDTAGTWNVAGNAGAAQLNFNLGAGSTYTSAAGAWAAGNFLSAPGAVNPVTTLNAQLFITGVALMVGAAAVNAEPEFRKYSDNLIDCMRYYEKSYAQGTVAGTITPTGQLYTLYTLSSAVANTYGNFQVIFKSVKRVSPTMVIYSPATGVSGKVRDINASADVFITAGATGDNGSSFYGVSAAATAQPQFSAHWTADADF